MRPGYLDRFDVRWLIRDHFLSMRKIEPKVSGRAATDKPDVAARIVLYGVPVIIGAVSFWRGWKLTDPGSVSAASALVAGILFAAFTQLASLRERLEDRKDPIGEVTRKHFRETAAHLMVGALAAAVEAAILVVASGVRKTPDDKLEVLPTAVVLALGAYVFLLFVMSVRRMYSAYLRVFEDGEYLTRPSRSAVPSGGNRSAADTDDFSEYDSD